ncbi:unnamed protein product [Cyprideis torosa]|uniref:Uncharacterized protein n=1 Tax=Cyprideis torosa TaxID=163714 RepID=A0A7R8WJC4_9CRUS|nr:unnamed protein product [Cyprideis torosa]CAG0901833.1 unnamed protein product [Cyprideis torosa]
MGESPVSPRSIEEEKVLPSSCSPSGFCLHPVLHQGSAFVLFSIRVLPSSCSPSGFCLRPVLHQGSAFVLFSIRVLPSSCSPPITEQRLGFGIWEPWSLPVSYAVLAGPWIGAIELGDSNEFVWASSNSPIEVPNWSPSRPNSPTYGDGVALEASNSFEWIDLSNGTEIPILCEILSNPTPVELTCPDGFFSLGESCYAVFDDEANELSWDEAQTFCASLAASGHLVEFETLEELGLVKGHLLDSDYYCGRFSNYWIGAEEIRDTNSFKWASSGHVIVDSDWLPGEPNGDGSGDAISLDCGAADGNWRWNDNPKSSSSRPICESPSVEVRGSDAHGGLERGD